MVGKSYHSGISDRSVEKKNKAYTRLLPYRNGRRGAGLYDVMYMLMHVHANA